MLFWANIVVFGLNTVVIEAKTLVYGEEKNVICWANTVVFKANPVVLDANTGVFGANTLVFRAIVYILCM